MKRRAALALCSTLLSGCMGQTTSSEENSTLNNNRRENKTKITGSKDIKVDGQRVTREEFEIRSLKYGQYPNRVDTHTYEYNSLLNTENKHVADFPDGTGYHPLRQATWIMRLITTLKKSHLNKKRKEKLEKKLEKHIRVETDMANNIRGSRLAPYEFQYTAFEEPELVLTPPWYSSISQGKLLSAYTRLYNYTNKVLHKQIRDIIASSLYIENQRYYNISTINNHYFYFEEYSTDKKISRVLNGFIFGIFGLIEFYLSTGSKKAKRTIEAALTTVLHNAHLYRVPSEICYYDLWAKRQFPHYHTVHIRQFRTLGRITGDSRFHEFADKLVFDAPGREPFSPESDR